MVLTAAHCVEDIENGTLHRRPANTASRPAIANPQQAQRRERLRRRSPTHVFPGFDPGVIHGDAALLILDRPDHAPPLALAGAADAALYEGGAAVQVAGWGLTGARTPGARRTCARPRWTVQNAEHLPAARPARFYAAFSPAVAALPARHPGEQDAAAASATAAARRSATRADGTPVELA